MKNTCGRKFSVIKIEKLVLSCYHTATLIYFFNIRSEILLITGAECNVFLRNMLISTFFLTPVSLRHLRYAQDHTRSISGPYQLHICSKHLHSLTVPIAHGDDTEAASGRHNTVPARQLPRKPSKWKKIKTGSHFLIGLCNRNHDKIVSLHRFMDYSE